MTDEKTGTCGCGTGCCSEPAAEEAAKRQVVIDFLFLDLEVCTWCKGTGDSLGGALAQVAGVLQAGGIEVTVNRIHVDSEETAVHHRFVSSPTIRGGPEATVPDQQQPCEPWLWGMQPWMPSAAYMAPMGWQVLAALMRSALRSTISAVVPSSM